VSKAVPVLILSGLLIGCAGVRHRPADAGDSVQGIRYYRSAPYLLVHSDAKGGIVSKIMYLPDQTQIMVAKPKSTLASLKTTLKFENGVLTSAVEEPDAGILPGAILSAAEKVLPALLAANAKPSDTVPAPHLYRIVVEGDEISFHGGKGDEPVRVRLRVPEKQEEKKKAGGE
jgi:hypothetical protein